MRFGEFVPDTEKWYSKIPQIMEMPNLIKVQLDSYDWFIREGLRELFDEISPIQDFTGSRWSCASASTPSASPSTTSVSAANATPPTPRRCASA